jgi:hypothetical protein
MREDTMRDGIDALLAALEEAQTRAEALLEHDALSDRQRKNVQATADLVGKRWLQTYKLSKKVRG